MIFTQIFNFQPKNTPKGPPDTKVPPLDVGMTKAHQPMVQILISLAQMVHFGWEQPLIIPDFGIFKVCAIPPTLQPLTNLLVNKMNLVINLRHEALQAFYWPAEFQEFLLLAVGLAGNGQKQQNLSTTTIPPRTASKDRVPIL